jgi:hypothetical protein
MAYLIQRGSVRPQPTLPGPGVVTLVRTMVAHAREYRLMRDLG